MRAIVLPPASALALVFMLKFFGKFLFWSVSQKPFKVRIPTGNVEFVRNISSLSLLPMESISNLAAGLVTTPP